ncbi:hypothetical protein [Mesorhizobium sp. SP-1A]|uniref:hypothetical protein n=1 Tax=Mesorhizobium sp. SP-1A TaxID=3077840 RepID=UPI0028F71CFF|nr:hypothetical protein [Mesorhizobium sp. SP-1A]
MTSFAKSCVKSGLVLAALVTLSAGQAQAISRYDPTRMACAQVQAAIARDGAVILRYQSRRTPGLPLYDRYVASRAFCDAGEVRDPAYVPSADRDSCPVYKCKKLEFDDPRDRFIMPD